MQLGGTSMKTTYSIIYDAFLNQDKYQKILREIEHEFVQRDIKGKKNKLNVLNSLPAITKQEVQRGAKNIIILGNDETFTSTLDYIVSHDVTVGFIPIGSPSTFAEILGLPQGPESCQIINQRLIKKLPVAQVNDGYFFNDIFIDNPNTDLQIICDNTITLSLHEHTKYKVIITNYNLQSNTQNEKLTIEIFEQSGGYFFKKNIGNNTTFLQANEIKIISNEPQSVIIDHTKELVTPLTISRPNIYVNVIVGKDRKI